MGSWGVNILQNDVSRDTKEFYINSLKSGKDDEQAYLDTVSEFADYTQCADDAVDFWLALSSVMYDYGRLIDEVKYKALALIGSSEDIERWNEKDQIRRLVVLDELKDKLNSPQPVRRKVTVYKRNIPEIKPNDVFYFKLEGDMPIYVLILVDSWINYDFRVEGLGDEHPLVCFKFCEKLPNSLENIDSMDFACLDSRFSKSSFIDSEKRVLIEPSGFKKFKSRLEYLGNYNFIRPKENELYQVNKDAIANCEILSMEWGYLESDIKKILKYYPLSHRWISR
ncbi:MAG: hypothetical protein K6F49_09690 [Saccharofermentans sp.]|nr:hypothetical protein [Saccharofermentans sp.]